MKKLILLAILCISCSMAFAQDYIRDGLKSNVVVGTNPDGSSTIKERINYDWVTVDGRYYAYNSTNNFVVPKPVLERYLYGRGLYKGGAATFAIGTVMSFIGGLCFIDSQKAGTALSIIGGTAMSIGIPLMCFGSHIKHETNHEYEMLRDGYFLAPLPSSASPKSVTETPSELPTPDF